MVEYEQSLLDTISFQQSWKTNTDHMTCEYDIPPTLEQNLNAKSFTKDLIRFSSNPRNFVGNHPKNTTPH